MNRKGIKRRILPRIDSPLIPFLLCAAVLLSVWVMHASGSAIYPGDINTDRSIDVSDAVLLARYCAEDTTAFISSEGKQNADVNADNNIDGSDLIMLLRQIAKYLPMPPNPFETTAPVPETTTESETTATESSGAETTTTAAETEAPQTETQPAAQELTADKNPYPLGVSVSVLTGQKNPDEMLTVPYQIGNIIFAIYAENPADTLIAIAYQDNIVGYYKACSEYTAPQGYTVHEYRDQQSDNEIYAVTILREDISIDFTALQDRTDLSVLSKLNYYALNCVRARNGHETLKWDEEAAKVSLLHSQDMAQKQYFDHITHTETGVLIYYEVDDNLTPLKQIYAIRDTNAEGTEIHILTDINGNIIPGPDGGRVILKTGKKFTRGYHAANAGMRLLQYGVDWYQCAENIDVGYTDPFTAMNGWFNSREGHRKTVLDDAYSFVGVGFAYDDSEKLFYGTQDFYSEWD